MLGICQNSRRKERARSGPRGVWVTGEEGKKKRQTLAGREVTFSESGKRVKSAGGRISRNLTGKTSGAGRKKEREIGWIGNVYV